MSPALIPAGVRLRADFDRLWPGRPKQADGWIGDAAHRKRKSDHNPDETGAVSVVDADRVDEVHAIDITRFPMLAAAVAYLVHRCRVGAEKRLRYVIWDHTIWSASSGWAEEPYDGDDPHTGHAHFSFSYDDGRESDNRTFHLEELIMTAPTAGQNADATAAKDIDPGAGTYSWAGAAWTTLARTAQIGPMATLVADLDARVEDAQDDLDAIGASMVLVFTLVGQLTNEPGVDPNPWYDVMRAAVRAELDAPAVDNRAAQAAWDDKRDARAAGNVAPVPAPDDANVRDQAQD